VTRIHCHLIDHLKRWNANRNRPAILRDGNRCPKHIAIHLADDILADLLPIVRAKIAVALQGEDPHVLGRADRESIAIGSDIHRNSEIVVSGIAVDGLAELHPVSAIIVGMVDFDVSHIIVKPRNSDRHDAGIGRERATDSTSPTIVAPCCFQLGDRKV